MTHLTPAEVVIREFGTEQAVADILGLKTRAAISIWIKRGVPHKWHQTLLREAYKRGYTLTEKDLVWGRKIHNASDSP